MEMAHSYKNIERANINLVGENMSLEEKIHGELLLFYVCFFYRVRFLSNNSHINLHRA